MSTVMNRAVEKEYLALVRAFPLLSIRDDEHLDEALAVIDRLTDKPQRSAAEDAYLNALTDLVETYESAHVEIPYVTPEDALRYLIEENLLTAEDMASAPDTAARILQHWLLAIERSPGHSTRNDSPMSGRLTIAQPHEPVDRQAWAHYLATLLDVPPDALDAFMKTISKGATPHEPKPTSGA